MPLSGHNPLREYTYAMLDHPLLTIRLANILSPTLLS